MHNYKRAYWYNVAAMLGIIVIGAILRIYRLGEQSMWQDEIYRTTIATYLSKGFGDVIGLAALTSQPPVSYWATRVMFIIARVLGLTWSDSLARFPSMVFGIATIPILYITTRGWFGKKTAWVATLLLAISPLHIRYSQEVAPYALWPLIVLIESYFLVQALRSRKLSY